MEAVALLLYLVALCIKVIVDVDKIKKDISIHHGYEAIFLLLSYLLLAYEYKINWYNFSALVFCYSLIAWLLIDLFLNIFRGKSLNYYGEEALLDKLLCVLNVKNVILFKLILILGATVLVKITEINL